MPGPFHGAEIIPLLLTIFWLWMLVDCLKNKGITGATKLLWVLLILFIHPFGAFLYLIFGRSRRHVQRQTPLYTYYQPPKQKQAPYYTPPSPQKEESYASYEQGYQVQQQERSASSEGIEQPPIEHPHYDQYEQPQATYPEQSQQQ
jgi:hypothetical protein